MSTQPLDDEEKLLALLNEVHRFPMDYEIRVICLADTATWLADRLVEVTQLPLVGTPGRRESASGRHVSVHMTLAVQEAPDVVRAYRAIRLMEGVKTFF